MFLLNSRLSLFAATDNRFSCFHTITASAPLLPKLRGYFAEFLNESYLNALVYSTRPPVSVSGTITFSLARGFSGQRRLSRTCLSILIDMPVMLQSMFSRICLRKPSLHFDWDPSPNSACLSASPHRSNAKSGAGIFNLLPIAYSNWPRLRHRLTLSG